LLVMEWDYDRILQHIFLKLYIRCLRLEYLKIREKNAGSLNVYCPIIYTCP
jgi:hypothetical protein